MSSESPAEHFPSPVVALGLTFAGVFLAAFSTVFVIALFGGQPSIASFGIGEALGLGAVAAFAARRVAEPQRERFGFRALPVASVPFLILLLPLVIVLSEFDNVIRLLLPAVEVPPEIEGLQLRLADQSWLSTLETFIVAVGIAPVVEEWLFRGVLQQGLVAHLSRVRGVVLTAALFAAVHIGSTPSASGSLSPFLSSFLLGLVLGTVRLATGSVLAPILLSAGISALGLLALGAADVFPIVGFNQPGEHTPAAVLIPSLFAVCWALTGIVRGASEAPIAIPLPGESVADPDL